MNDITKRSMGRSRVAGLAAAAALAAAPLFAASGSGREGSKVSQRVQHEIKEKEQKKSKKSKLDVLVRFTRRPGLAERALIRMLGGEIQKEYESGCTSVSVPVASVKPLAESSTVGGSNARASSWSARSNAAAASPGSPKSS